MISVLRGAPGARRRVGVEGSLHAVSSAVVSMAVAVKNGNAEAGLGMMRHSSDGTPGVISASSPFGRLAACP